jgi:hypothetical protein
VATRVAAADTTGVPVDEEMGEGEGGGVVVLRGEKGGEAEVEMGVQVGHQVLLIQVQLQAGQLRAQLNRTITGRSINVPP